MKVEKEKIAKAHLHRTEGIRATSESSGAKSTTSAATLEVGRKKRVKAKQVVEKETKMSQDLRPTKLKPTAMPSADNKKAARPWMLFTPIVDNNKKTELTHVSLFSGCGGFDL
jgi:hypothetical protein